MKSYGLRKINKDGKHYNFQWPLEVGAIVVAPDWDTLPECGGGLHVLPNAQGNYNLLNGDYWAVVEYDSDSLVMIGEEKGKVPSCKIVYLSEFPDGLLEYFKDVKFDSRSAYFWAINIGNKDYMRQFIDENYAYFWTFIFPEDKHYMRDLIRNEYDAYFWAITVSNDDKEYMRQFIKSPEYAYKWTLHFPEDREYMRQFVNDSMWAYTWALEIGDREYMRQFVKDPTWVQCWNLYIDGKESCDQTDK